MAASQPHDPLGRVVNNDGSEEQVDDLSGPDHQEHLGDGQGGRSNEIPQGVVPAVDSPEMSSGDSASQSTNRRMTMSPPFMPIPVMEAEIRKLQNRNSELEQMLQKNRKPNESEEHSEDEGSMDSAVSRIPPPLRDPEGGSRVTFVPSKHPRQWTVWETVYEEYRLFGKNIGNNPK